MKLSFKLFTAFLLISIMIVALMVGIMQYYSSRHFEDYVTNELLGRLTDVVDKLKDEYRQHQGWTYLQQHQQLWDQILSSHKDENGFNEMPPPPPIPPGPGMQNDGPFQFPPQQFPPGLRNKFSLFNSQKHFVMGRSDLLQNHALREIVIDGKTVGWLGLWKPVHLSTPLQIGFIYRQTKTFVIIGCGILVMTALVAFVLSRNLLKPINQLTSGAHALISRKFDTRVDVRSSDELGQLASDFNKMAATLERYEYMRRQWISDISHELRTPLAILRGEIEAVLDGVREIRTETLESLHAEVMLLTKIVNDLNALTVIESEAFTMASEPVNVIQTIVDVLKAFQPRFSHIGIEVESDLNTDMDLIVKGDSDRLSQVFSNIFENSMRYTNAPGKVRILHDRNSDVLHFYIEDSVPGVPDSAMPFIFDRLYRVDQSRSRTKGGSGLGLAISKAIIEAHSGKITASPSQLGGLKIEIILPIMKKI